MSAELPQVERINGSTLLAISNRGRAQPKYPPPLKPLHTRRASSIFLACFSSHPMTFCQTRVHACACRFCMQIPVTAPARWCPTPTSLSSSLRTAAGACCWACPRWDSLPHGSCRWAAAEEDSSTKVALIAHAVHAYVRLLGDCRQAQGTHAAHAHTMRTGRCARCPSVPAQLRSRPIQGSGSPAIVNNYLYSGSSSAPVIGAMYADVQGLSAGVGYQVCARGGGGRSGHGRPATGDTDSGGAPLHTCAFTGLPPTRMS